MNQEFSVTKEKAYEKHRKICRKNPKLSKFTTFLSGNNLYKMIAFGKLKNKCKLISYDYNY